ncbi:hypothetical protein FI667_g4237, partial [Globisporangium splendens]
MAAAATDVSTVTFAAGGPITVVGDACPDDDDVDTTDDAATLVAPPGFGTTTTALLLLTVTGADAVAAAADGAVAPALALEVSVAPSIAEPITLCEVVLLEPNVAHSQTQTRETSIMQTEAVGEQHVHDAPAAATADAQQQDAIQAAADDASGDATADAQLDEQQEPVRDDFLDVVVTSVDACEGSSSIGAGSASGVVASALSAPSSLLMGSQEYLVELVVTKGSGSYCIRRPLSELLAVLQLPDQLPSSALASIPVFPSKQSKNDALIAQWCGEMTSFLAGSRHEVVVPVKKEQHFIVWKFDLEEHDIDFSVTFAIDPQWAASQPPPSIPAADIQSGDEADSQIRTVHARTRYLATTTGRPVEGLYKCPGEGRATLVWDNSYSRLRGKNILYQVQVVSGSIMESATAAADALDEALTARRKERDEALAAALSTALIVSPATPDAPSLYKSFLPETLMQQSWIVSTSMNVAGKLASRLFVSQPDPDVPNTATHEGDEEPYPSERDSAQAKSLLEELNGLNMQLLERLENLEDKVVKLTVERDQERSKTHMAVVDKENTMTQVRMKELEVDALRNELQRMQREREAWREIQSERDALLEEKHRWAMADDFNNEEADDRCARSDMDTDSRNRLENELGQAEALVLRLRAELGYSLANHLTGTPARLEKVVREMAGEKKKYEDHMKEHEHEIMQLKQQLIKFRCQKKVLVTEIRNMKTQTEGQVSVAMAEASEARMVNKRLKKQNELLLTQIRTLVDDSRETERKYHQQQQVQRQQEQLQTQTQSGTVEKDTYSLSTPSPAILNEGENSREVPHDTHEG